MFTVHGTLADGKEANLVWREGYVFVGDRDAVAAVNSVIGMGQPVWATEEGPVFTPGYGDFETALVTACAAFDKVTAVDSDEPLPEYDGGVVQHPDDVQEALYDPHQHPRNRLGRWINVFRPSSRQDYEPDPLAPSGSTHDMVEGALAAITKTHDPPEVQPAERVPIIVREDLEYEATYAAEPMGNTGYVRPSYIRVNPDASKMSFVHEMGHYLDHILFGRKNPPATLPGEQFGSARAASFPVTGDGPPDLHKHELVPLFKLLSQTPALLQVQESMYDDTPRTIHVEGEEPKVSALSDYFLFGKYLLEPWEAFARAYAQWVALRSGDEDLLAVVEDQAPRPGRAYPTQWGEEEFSPIAAEFDRLFSERNLARLSS